MSAPDFDRDFRETGPILPDPGGKLEALAEALPHLRRPFEPAAVKWKVQTAKQGFGIVVAYIDVRLVLERLNLVVGGAWSDEFRQVSQGTEECSLTVFGVTRRDVGEGSFAKAMRSDSRKRAAVLFGIGVPIYAMAAARLGATSGDEPLPGKPLTRNYESAKKKGTWYATISPAGEEWLAEKYADWLEAKGEKLFGPPLEHGDEAGAAGVEGGDERAAVASSEAPESEPDARPQIEGEVADELRAQATEHYKAIRGMNAAAIPPAQQRVELEKAGSESLEALQAYVEKLAGVRSSMEEERAK